ncbi:unnamed protein product [Caenorhabditis brenneri]
MSTSSISLETLQYLLQHMDANRRFEIYNRCPALRAIEKSVPLKIESLILTESYVNVNDTTYNFGIIRNYTDGETPEYVAESNERGGVRFEVDRYGIRDELDVYTVTPGDVDIKLPGEPWIPRGVGTTLQALAPIIHEPSFPLKKIDFNLMSMDDVTNPIVQAAKTLKILMVSMDVLQNVSAITNPVVWIILITLSEQTLEGLIGNWIELKRPIGTEHTIILHREPRFVDEMEDILKRHNGVPIDDEKILIPMTDSTNLKVSYGPFPEFAPRSHWAVRFLTEAIQH